LCYSRSKEELISLLTYINSSNVTFLVDYEFFGKEYTGFDLIDSILMCGFSADNVYLVTSRSHEVEAQNYCNSKGVGMIPKYFALKIPFNIVSQVDSSTNLIECNTGDFNDN
jgi:hypothetical protein